jgi:uncharacterized membrane protein YccC
VAAWFYDEFGGPIRSRLAAYLTLAGAGAAMVVLGTLCSRQALLAAVAMALVAFGLSFSSVINGYFAAGAPAALLTFVFAATIPVPFSVVPARLTGWAFAAAVGIGAQLLLWPSRPDATLRSEAAHACLALADLVDATFTPDPRSRRPTGSRPRGRRSALAAALPGPAAPAVGPDRPAGRARLACRRTRLAAVPAGRSGRRTGGRQVPGTDRDGARLGSTTASVRGSPSGHPDAATDSRP